MRFVLEKCVPGDWREPNLALIAPLGTTKAQALKTLFQNLVPCLWGHCPFRYPVHRWTGSRKTFRDLGLPLNIHNLEESTYIMMLDMFFKSEAPAPAMPGLAAIQDAPDAEVEAPAPAESEAERQDASARAAKDVSSPQDSASPGM